MRAQAVLSATVLFALIGAAAAADPDPIMGKWVFSSTQSVYSDPAHALVRATAWYEPHGDNGMRFTSEIVRKDGSIIKRGWTANFDGKDYPVSGDDALDAVALRRVNRHTIVFVYKNGGKLVSAQVRDVSPDLRTMTLIQLGVTASGAATNNTVIFLKE